MNPRMRVKTIVAEPLVVNTTLTRKEIQRRVIELLAQVGLRADQAELYPHEFSGGQRQRIAVARALALESAAGRARRAGVGARRVDPRADHEPAQGHPAAYGLSYLLIAHNLATVRYMSHAVAIMYLGKIVEYGEGDELFERPAPPVHEGAHVGGAAGPPGRSASRRSCCSGEMPSPLNPPRGCHFHPRCPAAMDICREVAPQVIQIGGSHRVSCHLYDGGP